MAEAQTITSKSPEETFTLGVILGKIVTSGDVVTLTGELGAGKTLLTKGIACGLEIPDTDTVTSPSYTIINEYQGRLRLFHMDFYRLENKEAWFDLGLEEYVYGEGVTVMEWPERLPGLLPPERLEVQLLFTGENERRILLIPHGKTWIQRLEELTDNLSRFP